MSEEKKDVPKKENVDEDLSELLDSALKDFTKETPKEETGNEANEVISSNNALAEPVEFSNDFIQQAAGHFEENFTNLFSGMDPNAEITPEFIQQKFQQMADAAQQVLENPVQISDNSNDIAASISQAIQGLNAGAESLQAPLNEEDLMKMFGTAGGLGSENDLLPFMQGMMQGLLSKEVLGPSLEDFVKRLPEYIEKNKDTIPKEDIERYENQKKLMEEVLEELNKESDSDTSEVKKERFSKVLALMQKLQDYGQPPKEIVGDVEAPFNFDAQGNPNFGKPNEECCIM